MNQPPTTREEALRRLQILTELEQTEGYKLLMEQADSNRRSALQVIKTSLNPLEIVRAAGVLTMAEAMLELVGANRRALVQQTAEPVTKEK